MRGSQLAWEALSKVSRSCNSPGGTQAKSQTVLSTTQLDKPSSGDESPSEWARLRVREAKGQRQAGTGLEPGPIMSTGAVYGVPGFDHTEHSPCDVWVSLTLCRTA